jgi:16S rRNA (guanine527-N7)-methyltransferase
MSVAARPEAVTVTDAQSFAAASGATPAQMADLERYRQLLSE